MMERRDQGQPIQNKAFMPHHFSADELFSDKEIDRGAIWRIVEAGQFSFAGNNGDIASYAIVQDTNRLRYLADYATLLQDMKRVSKDGHRLGSYLNQVQGLDARPFHGASALILVCSNLQTTFMADAFWRSIENMVIAVKTLNLGVFLLDHELTLLNMETIKSELEIPESHTTLVALAIGAHMRSQNDVCAAKQPIWAWK